MKDRRPRTVSSGGKDASAATLCGLAEIEPCDQTQPKIIIGFGQITVLVGERRIAFYQIPLAKESMKYCGVATPFK
jgi:hypothetical protein